MEINLDNSTVTTVLQEARHRLVLAGSDTPQLDVEVLLAHVLNKERSWFYLHPSAQLDQAQIETFLALLARREQREPIAYLTGHKEFFGLDFVVNPAVLIPRPETELLVETAIQLVKDYHDLTIADVGTGSGCIAVALAKSLPQARIWAIDRSDQALLVARQNAARHQVIDRITFLKGDLLSLLSDPVDLIVSNPPYVSRAELTAPFTTPEVHRYEPRLALDGGADGLSVITRLLAQANQALRPGGSLLVEIGAAQGQAVSHLAHTHFPGAEVIIRQDLAGFDRLLVVQTQMEER